MTGPGGSDYEAPSIKEHLADPEVMEKCIIYIMKQQNKKCPFWIIDSKLTYGDWQKKELEINRLTVFLSSLCREMTNKEKHKIMHHSNKQESSFELLRWWHDYKEKEHKNKIEEKKKLLIKQLKKGY